MSFDDLFGAPEPTREERREALASELCAGAEFPAMRKLASRKGNRMSSLPVVQYCPQAARLGAQYGSGRAAAMSRYFHAQCAGVPCSEAVSAEELADIDTWHTPTDVTLWNGHVLRYADAEKELEVSLSFARADAGIIGTCEGHLDFAWHRDGTAYVADIKKSKWTTLDGPESLQLMAYGIAFALMRGADYFCTGIFVAETGEWQWLNRLIAVDSDEFRELQARVMAAALNTEGQASTGSHCRDCYARLHCPEHVLAATASIGFLAPIAEGHKVATPDELRGLLLAAQNVAELAEKAIAHVKEAARRGAVIADPETGKVYKGIQCKGRESVTPKSLREKMGDEAEKYIEQGKPYSMFRWVKP